MRQAIGIVLAVAVTFAAACGPQEQPPAKPAAPAATAPAQPAAPPAPAVAPPEAAKPVAPPAPAAKPAAPAKPPAAARPAAVADVVILPASQGNVSLPHLVHARLFPCATCHGDAAPGKISLTKETAHALCRDCHSAKGAGPTACPGCHQKKQ